MASAKASVGFPEAKLENEGKAVVNLPASRRLVVTKKDELLYIFSGLGFELTQPMAKLTKLSGITCLVGIK